MSVFATKEDRLVPVEVERAIVSERLLALAPYVTGRHWATVCRLAEADVYATARIAGYPTQKALDLGKQARALLESVHGVCPNNMQRFKYAAISAM